MDTDSILPAASDADGEVGRGEVRPAATAGGGGGA